MGLIRIPVMFLQRMSFSKLPDLCPALTFLFINNLLIMVRDRHDLIPMLTFPFANYFFQHDLNTVSYFYIVHYVVMVCGSLRKTCNPQIQHR